MEQQLSFDFTPRRTATYTHCKLTVEPGGVVIPWSYEWISYEDKLVVFKQLASLRVTTIYKASLNSPETLEQYGARHLIDIELVRSIIMERFPEYYK